jgi:hypothetical protein
MVARVVPISTETREMIEPVMIEPEALYDDGALRQALGLTPAALAAARRAGRLRFCRQGKRTLYRGSWILSWLESEASPAIADEAPRSERGTA